MLLGEEFLSRRQVGGAEGHGLFARAGACGEHAGAEQNAGKNSDNEKAAAKGIYLARLTHIRLAPLANGAGQK